MLTFCLFQCIVHNGTHARGACFHDLLLALINLLVVYCLQMWILAAQFEVRQQRLDAARKILGMSLGMCPKDRTYKAYIEVSTAILALEYQVDTMTSCTDQA